jgi:hypothetical protein
VNIFEARNFRFDFRAVQFFDQINVFTEIADGDGIDLLLFVRCRDWLSFCDDVQDALDRSQDVIDLALQSAASGLGSNPQALQVALGSLRLTPEGCSGMEEEQIMEKKFTPTKSNGTIFA